jgi:phenylalanine-4-hydroxylase
MKKKNKNGLVDGNSHTSTRKRSIRPVLRREQREQLEINHREDRTTDEQREQLENNHHENWTTDTSRRNELLYSVRLFGTNGLMEGAM